MRRERKRREKSERGKGREKERGARGRRVTSEKRRREETFSIKP